MTALAEGAGDRCPGLAVIDTGLRGQAYCSAGIYTNSYDASLNVKNGFPVFSTVIEANYIEKRENQFAAYKLTDEDKEEMHRLARDPRIGTPGLAVSRFI